MRDRRFLWQSGGIIRGPLTGFWSPTLTFKDPQIPHLPLEIGGAGVKAINVLDAGAGVDADAAVKAALTLLESGAGVETLAILARLSMADIGSGLDTLAAIKAILSFADAGVGLDELAVKVMLGLSDIGAGNDLGAQIKAGFTLSESGAGLDSPSIVAKVSAADLGVGSDSVIVYSGEVVPKSIFDEAVGLDLVFTRGLFVISDFGVGADFVSACSPSKIALSSPLPSLSCLTSGATDSIVLQSSIED